MSDNAGTSSGSSSYPGVAGTPPPYGQDTPPPPTYPGQQPPTYPGQPSPGDPGQPSYPGQYPPAYGSTDPNAYLGPPPSYPGGGYGVPPPPNQQTGWSGLAIAAFVASLVPLIGILAAVPLAIVALVKIAKTHERGKGLAIAAIIISVLWWIGFIGLGAWVAGTSVERNDAGAITKEGRIDFGEIRAGDCVNIPDPGGSDDINTFELKGVPCSEPHNAEAAALIPIEGDSFPGTDAIDDQTARECETEALSYLSEAPKTGLQPYRLIPTESIWDDDNGHRAICFVTQADYSATTGSVADK